jgi:hypothetical protein
MHPKFNRRFTQLEHVFAAYEAEIKNLSDELANQPPPNGGWSIAQVIFHIASAEKGIIQYLQKKLQNPTESKPAGLKSYYRATLLRYALRSKRKFRAPKALEQPQGTYSLSDLMNQWQLSRTELKNIFTSVNAADVNRQLFKHPVVGKISLKQTLGFMTDHAQRHLEQIKNIKAQLTLQT